MALVRHIVVWRYRDGFTADENKANGQKVKAGLERLKGIVPGIVELDVHIAPLSSSNADVALIGVFASESALAAYQVHPEHVRVSRFIGSVMRDRTCVDYFEA